MTDADLDFVAAMLSDPEVMRFYPRTYSRDEAKDWLGRQRERYLRDGHGLWLAVDSASERPIGQVGLMTQEVDGELLPEIGYLIHRPYWRNGYASEAALAVRTFAFREPARERVISMIRPENTPSQGVARKVGMSVIRRLSWRGFVHDVWAVRRADAGVRPILAR